MDIKFNFMDNSHMQLSGNGRILYKIREAFKFRVDGYMFHPSFKNGWDGYIHLIDSNNVVASGLKDDIIEYLEAEEISYDMDDQFLYETPYTKEYVFEWIDKQNITFKDGTKMTPYWFQKDAVWEYVRKLRTTLLFPTSAGKSLIQALCVRFFLDHNPDENVLIILPKTDLVIQLKDNFLEYSLFTEDELNMVMTGHKVSIFHRVNLSTWQSAVKFRKNIYDKIGFIMVDECHNAKAKSIQSIVTKAVNCRSRVGLTGTLGDDETENNVANILQIIGLFGKVFQPVTTRELIDAGIVSDIKIINIMLNYNDEFTMKVNGLPYQSEIKIITNHQTRTKYLAKLAYKLAKRNKGENVFMMFRFEEHGLMLLNELKKGAEENGIDPDEIYFINGKIDTGIRKSIRDNTERVSGSIIVASEKTFSEGISINNLHHAIICSPLKSQVTVLQTVGRLLRKHDSKKCAYLWDVIDDIALRDKNGKPDMSKMNYALNHGLRRMRYYNDEKFNRDTIKHKI